MPCARLQLEHTALLVVDVQEKLKPHIHAAEQIVRQIGKLIDGAAALGIPTLVTEQYRKGLGRTVPELDKKLDRAVCNHEKLVFSACIEPIRQELIRQGARTVLVCGIEAHVCVLQTCLDLIDSGFMAAVAVDAIGSRWPADRDAAIQRMVQVGVVPTTVESALLELVHKAGGDRFRAVLPIIK
ncbi:MAG: isochorismatase family protein [Phycisphaeraceae bacterium]